MGFYVVLISCFAVTCYGSCVWLESEYNFDKVLLKCKVKELQRSIYFLGPSGILRGYCMKPFTGLTRTCSKGVRQNLINNITTLVIRRPFAHHVVGQWKCIHGQHQGYDSAVIKSKFFNMQKQILESHVYPDHVLYGDIWIDQTDQTDNTVFNLTCHIYRKIIGNNVNVLLNQYTVGALRFYNNKCYTNAKECSDTSCSCTLTGSVFKIYYIFKNHQVCKNCTYGINMFVKGGLGGQHEVTLSKVFDGKGFDKLKTEESACPMKQQEQIFNYCKDELVHETHLKTWVIMLTTFIFIAVVLMIIVLGYTSSERERSKWCEFERPLCPICGVDNGMCPIYEETFDIEQEIASLLPIMPFDKDLHIEDRRNTNCSSESYDDLREDINSKGQKQHSGYEKLIRNTELIERLQTKTSKCKREKQIELLRKKQKQTLLKVIKQYKNKRNLLKWWCYNHGNAYANEEDACFKSSVGEELGIQQI